MMTFCEKWNDTNLIHREIVVWILIKMYIAKSNGLAAVSFLSLLVLGVDTKCSVREPSGVNSPPQHGDAGFHLSINEEPEFYEERNLYTITLKVIFIYKYILLKYIISTKRTTISTYSFYEFVYFSRCMKYYKPKCCDFRMIWLRTTSRIDVWIECIRSNNVFISYRGVMMMKIPK